MAFITFINVNKKNVHQQANAKCRFVSLKKCFRPLDTIKVDNLKSKTIKVCSSGDNIGAGSNHLTYRYYDLCKAVDDNDIRLTDSVRPGGEHVVAVGVAIVVGRSQEQDKLKVKQAWQMYGSPPRVISI